MNNASSSNRKVRWILIVAAVMVAAGLLLWWLLPERDNDGVLRLYGNVDIRELELSFRQPGRRTSMAFDEGDAVSAGEIMAQLDAEPYRERLDAAQAELAVAQAELDKLHSGNRPQEVVRAQQ